MYYATSFVHKSQPTPLVGKLQYNLVQSLGEKKKIIFWQYQKLIKKKRYFKNGSREK